MNERHARYREKWLEDMLPRQRLPRYTKAEPTMLLRWVIRPDNEGPGVHRTLQQRFAVTTYQCTTHITLGVHGEWRDVPVEIET